MGKGLKNEGQTSNSYTLKVYTFPKKVMLTMDVGVWEEILWSIEFPDDLETLQQVIDALEVYKKANYE